MKESTMNVRRKKGGYFSPAQGAPPPLIARTKRRVSFSEVDAMGIVWHGRYPLYFESGWTVLGRRYGLSYGEFFEARLRAPIVQIHVDYFQPLFLDEEFHIEAALFWDDGARLNMQYTLIKKEDVLAASGYTVQMFVDAVTGETILTPPPLLEQCRQKWKSGAFSCPK